MKRTIIATMVLVIITCNTYAQLSEIKNSNLIISGVPQYIVTNGIRIDFDIRKKGTNKWWVVSPYYYTSKSSGEYIFISSPYHDYDGMVGGGLG